MEEIEIIGKTIIRQPNSRPSMNSQVTDDSHVLQLSHLDTDRNYNVPFRSLRVYASSPAKNDHDHDPFSVIAGALSAALVHYHPVAGILRRLPADGRLELHCDLGNGVPFTTATCRLTLDSLNYLEEPGSQIAERLAPDPVEEADRDRPLMVQVTRFACGGFVLGICFHHAVVDGSGSMLFLKAMADFARGGPVVRPVWDRSALLGPREPPVVNVDFGRFFGPCRRRRRRKGEYAVKRECFHVNEACLNRLRARLVEESGSSFTSFEVLSAFIWRARIKAKRLASDVKVKLVFSMNIKNVLKPPLPSGYWGNVCVPVYVCMNAGELMERSMSETTLLIKKSKQAVNEEYVRSYLDFQKVLCCPEKREEEDDEDEDEVSGFTDWRHLGHSEVDFGWGGPVTVLPLSFRLLGGQEPSFFLPYSSVGGKRKDGFKVVVSLPVDVMCRLRTEMEILGTAGANL